MQRPWPILAGLGICVTLLVVSVLLASGLDNSAPVSAPGHAQLTAVSPTTGAIKVIPDRADLPDGDAPPGSGGAPIACRSR
jgi:hypothetical protein